jgi:hypothetical protein
MRDFGKWAAVMLALLGTFALGVGREGFAQAAGSLGLLWFLLSAITPRPAPPPPQYDEWQG